MDVIPLLKDVGFPIFVALFYMLRADKSADRRNARIVDILTKQLTITIVLAKVWDIDLDKVLLAGEKGRLED